MNEDIILQTLKEIRDDQKMIMEKITVINTEMSISRNGYTPHEIVEILHWAHAEREKQLSKNKFVRQAIINWLTPIILTGLVVGIFNLYK